MNLQNSEWNSKDSPVNIVTGSINNSPTSAIVDNAGNAASFLDSPKRKRDEEEKDGDDIRKETSPITRRRSK